MTAPFTAGLVQMAPAKTKAASLAKAASLIGEAAASGANVVCLPELFATPYFCRTQDHAAFDLAEPVKGPTTQAMARAARESDVTVIAPFFERRGPGLYHNTLAVIGPEGDVTGIYRKMHIPHDPGFEEKFYFTPGDLGFRAFPTPHGHIGALICWDQWFPEAARATALLGALMLFYPTAIGWHPSAKAEFGPTQRRARVPVRRAHAVPPARFAAVPCLTDAIPQTLIHAAIPARADPTPAPPLAVPACAPARPPRHARPSGWSPDMARKVATPNSAAAGMSSSFAIKCTASGAM